MCFHQCDDKKFDPKLIEKLKQSNHILISIPPINAEDLVIKHFSKIAGSNLEGIVVSFDLSNPFVVVGLLVGGMLPYLFGSMGIVTRSRKKVVGLDGYGIKITKQEIIK